jgi:polyisoprenoid-binding protein YceI
MVRLLLVICLLLPLSHAKEFRVAGAKTNSLALLSDQPSSISASLQTLALDQQSEVEFRVGILGLFKKTGTFSDMRGALEIGARYAKVSAVIRVKSAKMAKAADADLLLSEAFFHAEKFPEIRFASEQFLSSVLLSGGLIRGQITVRGISRAQEFLISIDPDCAKRLATEASQAARSAVDEHESQAARSAVDEHQSQAARSAVDEHASQVARSAADKTLGCPFHAKGSLQRSEFGISAKKAFVSDRVDLDLLFFATR